MRKILLIFLLNFSCTVLFFAGDLTVKITDGRISLPDTTVAITELKLNLLADENGQVIFKNIPDGKYTIIAVLAGYEKYSAPVEINSGHQNVSIRINKVTFSMGEITVKSKRNKGKVTTQSTVRQEELKANSQGYIQDAVKTLQSMPGVSGSGSMFDSSMYIQGGKNNEWVAEMDGLFIMNPNRWGGRISMFNPYTIEEIDLYTAGYPAIYGQGLSGIVTVETKKGNNEKWKGFIDMSTATSEIQLEGPAASNLTVFFDIRRTFYDFIMPYFLPPDQRAGVQYPYLMDGILKINWDVTPWDCLTFEGYGSIEGMKMSMSGDPNGPEQEGNMSGRFVYQDINVIGSARYSHRFESGDAFDAVLGYTPHYGQYTQSGSPVQSFDDSVNENLFQSGANYYLNSMIGHKIQFGGTIVYDDPQTSIDYHDYFLSKDGVWTNTSMVKTYNSTKLTYGGVYIEDNWEIIPSLILELGVREEYFSLNNEYAFNPQAGIKWEITKEFDLYLRGGEYHLFPLDITMVDSQYGNPNLRSQKVNHLITGMDYSDNAYSFRLEGFYKYYYDMWENDSQLTWNNNGIRNAYGGDIYLQKKAQKGDWLSGWISYTYVYLASKVLDRSPATSLFDYESNPPLNQWITPEWLRSHTLSAVMEMTYYRNPDKPLFLDFLNEWKLSMDLSVLSGEPYTPVTNFISYDTPEAGTQYHYFNGEYNSDLTPWEVRLDLTVTIPYSLFSLLNLLGMNVKSTSYISFINSLNYDNTINYFYWVKNGELSKVAVRDFPFMVLGGMRVEF